MIWGQSDDFGDGAKNHHFVPQITTKLNMKKEIVMDYQIGDIVRTKKVHPCGSKLWEITRIGVDFKLKCQGCGHVVMLPREKALKIITKLEKRVENNNLPNTEK